MNDTLIQQSSFFDLGRHFAMLSRQGRCYMDQKMEALDFSSGQHPFLFYLYSHNGSSQDEISRGLELDKATTARAIQKLEDSGYVTRKTSERDKRINRVYLTPKAYEIRKDIREYSVEWSEMLMEGLGTNDIEKLKYLIETLITNASKYRESKCKRGGKNA